MIDYACGAGHFLNTYANVVAQIEDQQPRKEGAKTTAQSKIYGIEKEYRLSKVAKVSSAMYGQNINITYADALDKDQFTEKDFDLLVANPPYSVKGFLETLSKNKKMCKSYELFDEGINLETNAIECFFVERANDLLKSHAKAAIILPVSILTKDGIYEKTRQILFRHFDIIAINELGGGTFGATGTNTIILFLSKKPVYASTNESQAYLNLKENIEESLSFENVFLAPFLREYCAFQNYPLEDFKAFLEGVLTDTLNNHEVFKEYRQAFLTSTPYKTAPEEEQNTRKEKEFITFCLEKEKEKLLYFSLIGRQKTLIIKSPTENKAAKKFLGYEWSDRKGSEGLKELNNPYCSPLFERDNLDNSNKIAFLIRNAFLNNTAMNATLEKDPYARYENTLSIPEDLEKFTQFVPLNQCLDFKTATFNKVISLTPSIEKISPFEKSKFELVKLSDVLKDLGKGKRPASFGNKNGEFNFYKSSFEVYKCSHYDFDTEAIIIGDGGAANINYDNGKFSASDHSYVFSNWEDSKTLLKFIYYVLYTNIQILQNGFKGIGIQNISKTYIKNIKIPLPPLEIQQQIVNACEEVEAQNHALDRAIADQHDTISAILSYTKITDADIHQNFNQENTALFHSLPTPETYGLSEWESEKLGNICSFKRGPFGGSLKKSIFVASGYKVYEQQNAINDNFFIGTYYIDENKFKEMKSFEVIPNDLIVSCSGTIGRIAIAPSNMEKGIINQALLRLRIVKGTFPKSLKIILFNQPNNLFEAKSHGSGLKNVASVDNLKAITIPLPPLEAQEKIVSAIEACEKEILRLENEKESLHGKTDAILKQYLF